MTDNLIPGGVLWFFATGTGLAPFMSLIRDPETYDRFDRVVLVHTVREVAELAYRELISKDLPAHELLGEIVAGKLTYLPAVTREAFRAGHAYHHHDRERLPDGRPRSAAAVAGARPGNALRLRGDERRCAASCWKLVVSWKDRTTSPGSYVVEKAFVTK